MRTLVSSIPSGGSSAGVVMCGEGGIDTGVNKPSILLPEWKLVGCVVVLSLACSSTPCVVGPFRFFICGRTGRAAALTRSSDDR